MSPLSSVGVRSGGAVATKKQFWEEYDAIDSRTASEIEAYENAPRHTRSGSQAQEALHYLFEENVESRKKYRMSHQEDFALERTGRILHMNQFLLMLREAGVRASYADKGAFPGTLGLYVSDGVQKVYVAFAQVPYMSEYEEVYFDRYDVPLGPKRRGWRTLLIRLIEAKLATESQLHEVFGAPPISPVTRRYWEHLHRIRNQG